MRLEVRKTTSLAGFLLTWTKRRQAGTHYLCSKLSSRLFRQWCNRKLKAEITGEIDHKPGPTGPSWRGYVSIRKRPQRYVDTCLTRYCVGRGGCCAQNCGCCSKARSFDSSKSHGHYTRMRGCFLQARRSLSNEEQEKLIHTNVNGRQKRSDIDELCVCLGLILLARLRFDYRYLKSSYNTFVCSRLVDIRTYFHFKYLCHHCSFGC
jgi:hypothetical protein